MKKTLLLFFILLSLKGYTQEFNNEWIDYTKTYYKFKVPTTGLYRINQPLLVTAGLANIPAEQFQLWRNGEQIALYTSKQSGLFGVSDYIEFWGEMNDGKPDLPLYREADYQLNDKWSLESDTAIFFLTVNSVGTNLRLTPTNNNLPSALPPEAYFMHTAGVYYKDGLGTNIPNLGYAAVVGEYVYSSAYDKGEGYTSNSFGANATLSKTFSDLNPYVGPGAPNPVLKINAAGNALNPRQFEVRVNSNLVATQTVDYFEYIKATIPLTLADINSGTAVLDIKNICATSPDRMVVAISEITYARQFNFGGANNFLFELPANASGNYLEVAGFNYGVVNPVLYDLTNGKRYLGDVSNPLLVKVNLEPSTVKRKLLLVTQVSTYPIAVTNLQTRNFVNYALPSNQGNYLIISHSALMNGTGGTTPVEDYKSFRSSAAGGSYNAKIYMIDQIVDQFGFGINLNPLSVRNFIRWSRNTFSNPVKHVFLLGRGMNYIHNKYFAASPGFEKMTFIPTFGYPASDNLLAAEPGLDETPKVPIGRLAAINGDEISVYLEKVKQYEQQQSFSSPLIRDKAWTKNTMQVIGANDGALGDILSASMNRFKNIIKDTLYGANVSTFSKLTTAPVEQANAQRIYSLFEEGLGMLTYFGHSSASTLEFNLDNPNAYNNQGKYPLFILLGCNAGNFFNYSLARLSSKETISEKYVLAEQRGGIATIASTSLGIVHYLDIFNSSLMAAMSNSSYGKSIGEALIDAINKTYAITTQNDFYARFHCEQSALHGDPALKMDVLKDKPDYAIEEQLVKINPNFISVAETSFEVNAKFINLSKAINKKVIIEVKRTYPNLITETIRRDTLEGIRYSDSLKFQVPIDAIRDKGLNKISICIDPENEIDELYESNNCITKDVFIFEDEIRPVYPFNYSIVNKQGIKFEASTANAFASIKQYKFEIDTTKLFNSSLRVERTVSSQGGVIEFDPGITFIDSTVYYWRTSPVPATGSPNWNYSSFTYLTNHADGFGQSHYYQHLESATNKIQLLDNRKWAFDSIFQNLFARNTIYPEGGTQQAEFTVAVNGDAYIGGGCTYNAIIFNVFEPNSMIPWLNSYGPGGGLYESLTSTCGPRRERNFEYSFADTSGRRKMMNFLNNVVPDGYIVVARGNIPSWITGPFPNDWRNDTTYYGSGNSIYHILKNQGFATLDSFNRARTWIFIYKKNSTSGLQPAYTMGETIYDKLTLTANIKTSDTAGYISSPVYGRAKKWHTIKIKGTALPDLPGIDSARLNLIGVNLQGQETTLLTGLDPDLQSFDISNINASVYPFLKLKLYVRDKINFTPYQLNYWRILFDPAPEGAIAPNIFLQKKDTVEVGEPIDFKVAFKNVSHIPFDSLKVKLVITDRNNISNIIPVPKKRPLTVYGTPNDTIHLSAVIKTNNFPGNNTLYIEANPDEDQPEQFHFNNFAFRNIYAKQDSLNPLLDVTFDGVHILDKDIVSSKPDIVVKLKDEAKWLILDDTSLLTLKVRYPDQTLRRYYFSNDTVQFIPAGQAPNPDNTATINFKPYFTEDGEYELIVSGKDKSNNKAGDIEYRVFFKVINKPMISNMLNYPNPFTTSTAFVFTITGNEVPQNIKIEIMTITGKIVREITKTELGPLHIGRNITEFKWDGTDQFGQKLANGIYLYRVVTNLNGKMLDKYKAEGDKTDQYFNKGYGKMYLMR